MAAFYIDAIRRIQPKGPYNVGGFSVGGQIAIEMARQLIQNHKEVVEKVILMDTYNLARFGADHMDELLNAQANDWSDFLESVIFSSPPASGVDRNSSALSVDGSLLMGMIEQYKKNFSLCVGSRYSRESMLPSTTEIVLIKAMKNPYGNYRGMKANGWGDIFPHLAIQELDCSHYQILEEPFIKQVSRTIFDFVKKSKSDNNNC